ncbi:MAG: CsbD family protein, partial [Acidobacteria bacterium]
DNDRLHDEGVADETAGKVQEGFGKGRRKVGEALKDLGDEIKR